MIWVLIGLGIIAVIEGYIIFNLNRKVKIYENWISEFTHRSILIENKLNELDRNGTFQSDDEVGYFYDSMKEILKRLTQFGILTSNELNNRFNK